MRVFLDTNVIVSAVTTRGLCADVFRTVLADHELVSSPLVLKEVRRILNVKFAVPEALVAEYLDMIGEAARMSEGTGYPIAGITDKDDIEILASAIEGESRVFITGDREIQDLKSIRDLRILSPRAFWEELTTEKT